jgi:hypothetical protein
VSSFDFFVVEALTFGLTVSFLAVVAVTGVTVAFFEEDLVVPLVVFLIVSFEATFSVVFLDEDLVVLVI